jgi:preprotein translocase subunit YajC
MPTELIASGAVLVILFGVLTFVLIRRQKPVEPPHFR